MSRAARRLQASVKQATGSGSSDELTAQGLTAVKSKRILFGHQSVGGNMMSGVSDLYASYSVSEPTIIDYLPEINSASGGFFAEFYVGDNYDPLGKIADFNTVVRQYASRLDIAFMKFCFVDILAGTNITQVFNSYRSVMDALSQDFPALKIVYVTAALDEWEIDNAVAREQLNTLIRQTYGATGRVFDLAAVESTRPDGSRVSGIDNGNTYYQLYGDYSSDGGHLNDTGVQVVDKALFALLAKL